MGVVSLASPSSRSFLMSPSLLFSIGVSFFRFVCIFAVCYKTVIRWPYSVYRMRSENFLIFFVVLCISEFLSVLSCHAILNGMQTDLGFDPATISIMNCFKNLFLFMLFRILFLLGLPDLLSFVVSR